MSTLVSALAAAAPPPLFEAYGPDPLQHGELHLPDGPGPFPVAVVLHGGCWTRGYATLASTTPLARALAARGLATWNVEYRQVGDPGGGWPGTFLDWGRAVDHLRALGRRAPLDLSRVLTVGHSAGGHAALWLAARPGLPETSALRGAAPLPVHGAVVVDGVVDLAAFIGRDAAVCGRPVVTALLGGTPAEQPRRYAEASPAQRLPLRVPHLVVAAALMSPKDAAAWRRAAQAEGDTVEVLALEASDHLAPIDPGSAPGRRTVDAILRAVPEQPRAPRP